MKTINLSWAKTPYMRSHNDSCGNEALVSFDQYVDKKLFEIIKPEWIGYIEKNNKKTALYNSYVIDELLKNDYQVVLSGVEIKPNPSEHNYLSNSYLLSVSSGSTNDMVNFLAQYQQQLKSWEKNTKSTIEKIQSMFDFSAREDNTRNPYQATERDVWQHLKIGQIECHIEKTRGFRNIVSYDEPTYEYFVPVNNYSKLKPTFTIEQLNQTLREIKELPKRPEFNIEAQWCEGYNSATWEPKKSKTWGYR